jgi:hypothetical protein
MAVRLVHEHLAERDDLPPTDGMCPSPVVTVEPAGARHESTLQANVLRA